MATTEARTISLSAASATIRVTEPADAAATIALRVAMAQESEFLSGEPGEIRTDIDAVAEFLGKKLASPDQLRLDSMVYRASSGAQPAALDKCGEHRCVRLFPKVKNGPWIDSRDLIIDLSARKVAKLH